MDTGTDPMVDFMREQEAQAREVLAEGNGEAPSGAAASVWGVLQARRAQLAGERHLDLEVPGTFGLFTLRLGPISGQKLAQLTDRLQKSRSPDRDYNLNADYLIASCQGILGRQDPSRPKELMVDEAGDAICLDRRLADAFGLPQDIPMRGLVKRLYAGAPSPEMAVQMAGGEYVAWAAGITPELDEEALGEA